MSVRARYYAEPGWPATSGHIGRHIAAHPRGAGRSGGDGMSDADDPTRVQHVARRTTGASAMSWRALTDEQLAIRPAPDRWPLWATVGPRWPASGCSGCATSPGEPGAETTPFTERRATTARGTTTCEHVLSAEALVEALDSTFRIVERCLDTWTLRHARRGDPTRRTGTSPAGCTPAAAVIQRVFSHDIWHCAELNETLGIARSAADRPLGLRPKRSRHMEIDPEAADGEGPRRPLHRRRLVRRHRPRGGGIAHPGQHRSLCARRPQRLARARGGPDAACGRRARAYPGPRRRRAGDPPRRTRIRRLRVSGTGTVQRLTIS